MKNIPQIEFQDNGNYDEQPKRRKMDSTERQLFNLFEERGKNLFKKKLINS